MKAQGKIATATTAEKQSWADQQGTVYPLYGWLRVSDGHPRRPIEDLRGAWNRPDPQYEVHAPPGYVYYDTCHTHLCFDLADVRGSGADLIKREAALLDEPDLVVVE